MNVEGWLETIRGGGHLSEPDLALLLAKLSEVLYQEPTLLTLPLPITICGDIHGQLYDLFELFRVSGGLPAGRYLFLGDYVDRGFFSVETFSYLAALKLRYPESVFLLRGNHECREITRMYSFLTECVQRYGHAGPWRAFNDVFDLLPMAALVCDEIFCVHGGLSPTIRFVEQIPTFDRCGELQMFGPLCSLAWSDPADVADWQPNQRGAGLLFGPAQTGRFCHENALTLICRAHQVAMEGFEWHFGEQQIVTVWSAPKYGYTSVNKAAVLKINSRKETNFVVFEAVPNDKRVIPEELQSPYFV
jgi:diadenosine tetraphosphatase ApaH/serine/threonine PP2A family protein phosphatase